MLGQNLDHVKGLLNLEGDGEENEEEEEDFAFLDGAVGLLADVGTVETELGEDGIAIRKKRPKLIDECIANLSKLNNPEFAALGDLGASGAPKLSTSEWLTRMITLYKRWGNSVAPHLPFKELIRRVEGFSSNRRVKDELFHLSRSEQEARWAEEQQAEEEERRQMVEETPFQLDFDARLQENEQMDQLRAEQAEDEIEDFELNFDNATAPTERTLKRLREPEEDNDEAVQVEEEIQLLDEDDV